MSTAIFVVGLIVTLAGVVLVVIQSFSRPAPPPPGPQADGGVADIGDVIKQLNELLAKVDQRFRLGVIVMAVGLALVGVGAYLEAHDAKDAADKAKPTSIQSTLVRGHVGVAKLPT